MAETDRPSASVDTATVQSRLLSKCQQLMAVAALCEDNDALQCAMKHVQTAEASLRATERRRACKISTARRLAANKKVRTATPLFQYEKETPTHCNKTSEAFR